MNQMADYEHKVFISYAWGEETSEREAIVNQLDQSLQKRGLKIVRDKRDLGYKGSIRRFMERIGEGDSIIVIISDKYLRSKNCMYELVEIAKNKQFADRIFPIILSDAKIYDASDRLDYIAHWDNEKDKLNKKYGELKDKSNTESILEQLSNYDRFGDEIDGLTNILKDMNTLTPDMHRDSDFSELFTAIEKRMKDSGTKAGTAIEDKSQLVSAVTLGRKPLPVGVLIGGAAVLLVVVIIAFSALGNRDSNVAPPVETAEPSAAPTLTVAPTQTAVEATATEESAPTTTVTETVSPPTVSAATEITYPAYFTENFTSGIDPALWEFFFLGAGDPGKASVVSSENGIRFSLKDPDIYAYYIYKPVTTYTDVVTRLRFAKFGSINENGVRLMCRRKGNTWYEYRVSSGGPWWFYYYDGSYNVIASRATTFLKSGSNINEIEMSCIGNEISLRVNGKDVWTVTDNNLTAGQVGFNISSLRFFPVEIEIKQFEVTEP